MEALKTYLRTLGDEPAREAFASRCNTTLGHLRNAVVGYRRLDLALCSAIERESGGAVTCEALRDDVPWKRVRGRPMVDVTDWLYDPKSSRKVAP